jgi:hypothetical protein
MRIRRHALGAAAAAAILACGAGADAQPYDPPPSAWTTYWDVPAFKDHPYKGPAAAKGVLFWSHGVSGKLEQYGNPPPEIIRDFARDGWDVVKIQRNNLHESGWSTSGVKHVADLLERVEKAHAQGYRRIIAGGQSYGGAISIEASGRTDKIFGVLATGPGHGSDACGTAAARGSSFSRIADNVQRQLADAIGRMGAQRAVVVMAANDECQGFNNPTPTIHAALTAQRGKFLFLDDTMPLAGHGAAALNQFRVWYGACIRRFLDPDVEPAARETRCPHPDGPTSFLLPAGYRMPEASSADRLLGAWSGSLAATPPGPADGQEICLAIEARKGDALETLVAFGAGPERRISMTNARRALRREGEAFVFANASNSYRLSVTPRGADALDLQIVSASGQITFSSRLARGC